MRRHCSNSRQAITCWPGTACTRESSIRLLIWLVLQVQTKSAPTYLCVAGSTDVILDHHVRRHIWKGVSKELCLLHLLKKAHPAQGKRVKVAFIEGAT